MRCVTRRTMASTGHREGLPDLPRPMTSPRTPFFWVVNVKETNVAVAMVVMGAVKMSMYVPPVDSRTSDKRNGVVSDGVAVYSPGRSRKKKANAIMSAMAGVLVCPDKVAAWRIHRRTVTGTGFTRLGGGFCFA